MKLYFFRQDFDVLVRVSGVEEIEAKKSPLSGEDYVNSLNGFLLILSSELDVLYVSDNVKDYLGLSTVSELSSGGYCAIFLVNGKWKRFCTFTYRYLFLLMESENLCVLLLTGTQDLFFELANFRFYTFCSMGITSFPCDHFGATYFVAVRFLYRSFRRHFGALWQFTYLGFGLGLGLGLWVRVRKKHRILATKRAAPKSRGRLVWFSAPSLVRFVCISCHCYECRHKFV